MYSIEDITDNGNEEYSVYDGSGFYRVEFGQAIKVTGYEGEAVDEAVAADLIQAVREWKNER